MEKEKKIGKEKIEALAKIFFDTIVKKFGEYIKASWVIEYEGEILVIVLVNDLKASEEIIRKIKNECLKIDKEIEKKINIVVHISIVKLSEYFREIIQNKIDVFIEITRAFPIYDPSGFFRPIKRLVEKGEIRGTKESMMKLISEVRQKIDEANKIKLSCLSSIYSAVVDAAEAALLVRGISFYIPKQLPPLLQKTFLKEKKISKKTLDVFNKIYNAYKDYEHENKIISGEELDKLIADAYTFIDEMQEVARAEMKV